MSFKVISEVKKLAGKIVLMRIDCNVPMEGKKIVDDARLRGVLPTLRWLERHGSHIILIGHLGRPAGKVVTSLSLKPIGYALGKLLKKRVQVLSLSLGSGKIKMAARQGIILLENIRFEPGEDKNDIQLVKRLASLGNIYVNEAFSVSHRPAASIVGLAKCLPCYAGLQMAHEVVGLEKIRKSGFKPVVAIIGGAKVADKLPVITKLLPRVNAVLTGGAVANTFLKAKGYCIGKSLFDKDILVEARRLLRRGGKKIILPIDVISDDPITKYPEHQWRSINKIGARERVVDIGTNSCRLYAQYIKKAKTIFWSGTLGLAEQPEWCHASLALGRLVSARARGRTYVVVGGGDTAAFFNVHKLWVDYESLAGSAMLEFLAGKKLPGLEALGN